MPGMTKDQQRDKLRTMHVTYRQPPKERVKQFTKRWTDNGQQKSVTLDYIGHADLTDILLDEDPLWNWEPGATDPATGEPVVSRDAKGWARGLWIKLTIHGLTRWGYGTCPAAKSDAQKILIGNAMRNAAMRFGIGLSLWKANTDALLVHGLDPDDQSVVEGDDEAEDHDPDAGAEAVRDTLTTEPPVAPHPPAAAQPAAPAAAANPAGQCPECHGPAGKHGTGCSLAAGNGATTATVGPDGLPAGQGETVDVDDLDMPAVRVEIARYVTAMRNDQAERFVDYRRVNKLPNNLLEATDDQLRGLLRWFRGQPVARVVEGSAARA